MERPSMIASKPPNGTSSHSETSPTPHPTRSFACFNCANRKTKCDKERPACGACQRRQLTCAYEESAGPRKRKATEDANGRLERFERILARRGLMEDEVKQSESSTLTTSDLTTSDEASTQHLSSNGRLIADKSNSRYINSTLWRELENQGLGEISEEQASDHAVYSAGQFTPGLLSHGLLGATEDILKYHPSAIDAKRLWKIYVENVEPLCKFLHVPTAHKLVEVTCQGLSSATAADQCLLFAIYLLAIFSMTENECLEEFGQARAVLLSRYDYSIRQALFNASWLSTNQMSTLVAFTMYLSVVRRQTDARSLWIWTGTGIRIMQRMGIHRDGEYMGLRPFDVEMRRRLYWHLVSIDTIAGRISGTSDGGPHKTWDTKIPSNINDDQIHPEMTEMPNLRDGATDMMFSLVRIKLETLFLDHKPNVQNSVLANHTSDETKKIIDSAENEIESKFLRYCDPVEPMHALTLMTARSSIAAARLRQLMPLVSRSNFHEETQNHEFYGLSRRIMDADSSAFTNPHMKPFLWKVRASFRWDALICLLVALDRPGFFTPEECEGCWKRIGEFFNNHAEVLEARDTLQRMVGRMTLRAWLANSPKYSNHEPKYITALRSRQIDSVQVAQSRLVNTSKTELGSYLSFELDSSFDINTLFSDSMFGIDNSWDSIWSFNNEF